MTLNKQNELDCVEINPNTEAKHTIIWLHGLGANGYDFVPIVPALKLAPTLGVRFVFPHAPIMPVTLNQGYKMPAWFDIYELSPTGKIDREGIAHACELVNALIAKEESGGIASDKIMLAGFSQGAATVLTAGLKFPKPLAGIIALSGFLPLSTEVFREASAANRHIPIFIAHGDKDPTVPYALGNMTYEALLQAGYKPNWHTYNMTHTVCDQEIQDLGQWINHQFIMRERPTDSNDS